MINKIGNRVLKWKMTQTTWTKCDLRKRIAQKQYGHSSIKSHKLYGKKIVWNSKGRSRRFKNSL